MPAHQWYGDLLIRMGYPEHALDRLREGLLLDPLSPRLANEVADALAGLGQFDAALAELDEVIETYPEHALSYWRAARINAFALGRFDEAIGWMDKSLAIDPGDAYGSAFVGALYAALGDPTAAQDWIAQALELGPNSSFVRWTAVLLAEANGDTETIVALSEKIVAARGIDGGFARGLAMLRNLDVANGLEADAVDRYRRSFPALFISTAPTVDASNYQAAAGLAVLLHWVGDHQHAALLNAAVVEQMELFPRTGWSGFGIIDVQLHAAQGRTAEALAGLRDAVDSGWRPILDIPLARDPTLETLWKEADFKTILAEIDADMTVQLARVRQAKSIAPPVVTARPPGGVQAPVGAGG